MTDWSFEGLGLFVTSFAVVIGLCTKQIHMFYFCSIILSLPLYILKPQMTKPMYREVVQGQTAS